MFIFISICYVVLSYFDIEVIGAHPSLERQTEASS